MSYNTLYFLLILAVIFGFYAQTKVKSNFAKYSRVANARNLSGAMVAERILREHSIYDVQVIRIAGQLTDHYDPTRKTVALSESVYGSNSIAAIAVAAHECGHVIQHHEKFSLIGLRNRMLPAVNISSKFSWVVIMLGFIFNNRTGTLFLDIGILMYLAITLFHILTLPIEFDASRRAIGILENGFIEPGEVKGCKDVLGAAAMTYLAATLGAILQLLRIIAIRNSRND